MRKRRSELKALNSILIITEGKSEKLYFSNLIERGSNIDIIVSENKDPIGMIDYCISKIRHKGIHIDDGDLAFCVLDVDNNTRKDFEEAIKIAERHNISIIISNPKFEIWYLMHYMDFSENSIESESIIPMLQKHIKEYSKITNYWTELSPNKDKAIKMSETISQNYNLTNTIDFFDRRCCSNMPVLFYKIDELKNNNKQNIEDNKRTLH